MDWVVTEDRRPKDGQEIVYFFEPFGTVNIGTYVAPDDTVCGPSGFTTMVPEVPKWLPLSVAWPEVIERQRCALSALRALVAKHAAALRLLHDTHEAMRPFVLNAELVRDALQDFEREVK